MKPRNKDAGPAVMLLESTTAYQDGSQRCWPCGTPRSYGGGFTHGHTDRPHGFRPGGSVPTRPPYSPSTPASRSKRAFGAKNGTVAGLGDKTLAPSHYRRTPG